MALAWSSDGHRLVSIGKDLMLNVHHPQLGDECLVAQKKVSLSNFVRSVARSVFWKLVCIQAWQHCHIVSFDSLAETSLQVIERAHSGRVFYACDDRLIIVVGMTRSSARQVSISCHHQTQASFGDVVKQLVGIASAIVSAFFPNLKICIPSVLPLVENLINSPNACTDWFWSTGLRLFPFQKVKES